MVWFQVSGRKSLESSLRQLEREKALLQHKSQESHRKAESEADRKRCLENEGEVTEVRKYLAIRYVNVMYVSQFVVVLQWETVLSLTVREAEKDKK